MRFALLGPAVLLVLFALPAGQDRVVVQGTISDSAGGAIPGVSVTATNEATGAALTVSTDETGHYRLSLVPGRYTIRVEFAGFGSRQISGVDITESRAFDITLRRDGTSG